MSPDFESSVFDKRLLTYQLNRYAGPPKKFFGKFEGSEEEKAAMKVERKPYDGPEIPLTQDLERKGGTSE